MDVPRSTYRLQLHAGFGFRDAAAVCDRLAALGVTHVYLSPVLQAAPGSMHGYDVIDHSRLSADLGGESGWRELVDAAHTAALGIVVDVVPNHMAVPTPESLNRQLWDVLAHGRDSAYAHWFDIDWGAQGGRMLMPVLGAPPEEVAGDLKRDGDVLRYFDHELPLPDDHYRLADWRTASQELNWRRFFDVTSLIGVRVEDPDVFAASHERLVRLVADGDVDGLRIDHPDGLADPGGYLDSLSAAVGDRWVVVEKILEGDEVLPASWRCAGTTGYDAIAQVTGVLVDPSGERPLTGLYTALTGAPDDFHAVAAESKRLVVTRILRAEVERLADELLDSDPGDGLRPDRREVVEALEEVLVGFEVYRAYPGSPEAERQVGEACERARARRPDRAREIDLVGRMALVPGPFATRFGQTTGPVMAKGIEDTAFYRWHRLAALNEVGGDPATFGRPVAAWHEFCARLQRDWPATQTTLSTHDTKRSEDVRARLLALAELPTEWAAAAESWRVRRPFGDPNIEYLFWQTLVGAWPLTAERAAQYIAKAAREAKQRTSWTDPDPAYDDALAAFVRDVFADESLMGDVERFVRDRLLLPGRVNSLSQKLLQLAMPGVPDVYQGQELWGLSLVDPDNRRPVDHPRRTTLLAGLDAGAALPPLEADDEGASKLLVTSRALRLRRERPDLFTAYDAVSVTGAQAEHAVAFSRGGVVAVATRLPVGFARSGGWGDTRLELDGSWRDALTGATYDAAPLLADVLATLPVALLVRVG